jgi:two-component system NarL family response regulator
MTRKHIDILCVDDHRVVLEGIKSIIRQQADMRVVATATTGEEGVDLFRQFRPDVTLMDLRLPGMSGLDAIREIHREQPAARIVTLTMYEGDEDVYRALEAGAVTYLLKDTVCDDLVRTIRDVHAGQPPIPAVQRAALANRARDGSLTFREVSVIELMATGLRNKEIAAVLEITEETVKVHVRNILEKLNVSDRTAAVTVALKRGIIHFR